MKESSSPITLERIAEIRELMETHAAEKAEVFDIMYEHFHPMLDALEAELRIPSPNEQALTQPRPTLHEALEEFRIWLARTPAFQNIGISDDPPTTVLTIARARIQVLEGQRPTLTREQGQSLMGCRIRYVVTGEASRRIY